MTDPKLSTDQPQQTRAPYATPKMVVLGNVRDLTLSGGSQVTDAKSGTRGNQSM